MARVTWHIQGMEREIRNASLPAPKRAAELFYWFKAAREALPQIPNPEDGVWLLSNAVCTVDIIIIELHSGDGAIGFVIIDRKAPTIGIN